MIDWDKFYLFFSTGIPWKVLLGSLMVTTVAIVFFVHKGLRCSRSYGIIWRNVLWVFLAEYLFVVSCSTVIFRGVQTFPFAKLELAPFWTYRAVLNHTSGVSVWDIVLNVVLFLPFGFLVKLLFPSLSLGKMLLIAVGCSLCIETSQIVFEKGVAQFDDVMHNAIGAGLGWGVAKFIVKR